jgi:fibronectin type III domain protein
MFCTRRWEIWGALSARLVVVMLLAGAWQAVAVNNITLAWDANPESDIAGYKVHSGTNSRVYPAVVDVGKRTNHTVSNLMAGRTYFLALTAYDATGLESDFSAELSYTVPADLALAYLGAGRYRIRFSAAPGVTYGIEYSERLDSPVWQSLGTRTANSNGLVEFIDTPGTNSRGRFYRAVSSLPLPLP